jgi:hypothetical protein
MMALIEVFESMRTKLLAEVAMIASLSWSRLATAS